MNLSKFPQSLTPAGWTGKRTTSLGDPITDKAGNEYIFSCYKVVKRTRKIVILYGELNESSALETWGQRRYVLITGRNAGVTMEYLGGPRNYD